MTGKRRDRHCEELGALCAPSDKAIQTRAVPLDCFAIARNDGGYARNDGAVTGKRKEGGSLPLPPDRRSSGTPSAGARPRNAPIPARRGGLSSCGGGLSPCAGGGVLGAEPLGEGVAEELLRAFRPYAILSGVCFANSPARRSKSGVRGRLPPHISYIRAYL
jgi:hypothetical protein